MPDKPELNLPLMVEVMNQIVSHPETHDQSCWHSNRSCGTTHCFAGWTQVKVGLAENNKTARDDAKEALGLTEEEADYLFDGDRTVFDLHAFVSACLSGNRDRKLPLLTVPGIEPL